MEIVNISQTISQAINSRAHICDKAKNQRQVTTKVEFIQSTAVSHRFPDRPTGRRKTAYERETSRHSLLFTTQHDSVRTVFKRDISKGESAKSKARAGNTVQDTPLIQLVNSHPAKLIGLIRNVKENTRPELELDQ